jgi:hypothetical protein
VSKSRQRKRINPRRSRCPDRLRPALDLLRQEPRQIFRRPAFGRHDFDAELFEALTQRRAFERPVDGSVELADDGVGRALRQEECVPHARFHPRHALLAGGRHVRDGGDAMGNEHGDRLHWGPSCRNDYIDLMAGVLQIAADSLQRPPRQSWVNAESGLSKGCSIG